MQFTFSLKKLETAGATLFLWFFINCGGKTFIIDVYFHFDFQVMTRFGRCSQGAVQRLQTGNFCANNCRIVMINFKLCPVLKFAPWNILTKTMSIDTNHSRVCAFKISCSIYCIYDKCKTNLVEWLNTTKLLVGLYKFCTSTRIRHKSLIIIHLYLFTD